MIEFFFDCASPWTYVAFHNVQPLAGAHGVEIDWRPMLVGGVFNAANRGVYEQREQLPEAKRRYVYADLKAWAARATLDINPTPSVFPVNSVRAMRACVHLKPQGRLVDFARATFEAYWARDQDISRTEVLAEICQSIDVDAAEVLQAIETTTVRDALRRNGDELIARGGFGSPTIFVDHDKMFFGNDRLPLVADALVRFKRSAAG
jgi:2-hydroxychromene-2-carboxylate isomerase